MQNDQTFYVGPQWVNWMITHGYENKGVILKITKNIPIFGDL